MAVESWAKAEDYLLFAVGCALTASFATGSEEESEEGWQATVHPYILRKRLGDVGRSKQLQFRVVKGEVKGGIEELRVKVRWEWMGDEAGALKERKSGMGEGAHEWVGKIGAGSEEQVRGRGEWDDGEGEVVRSMKEVVEEAGKV